jgi:hypothetical protein
MILIILLLILFLSCSKDESTIKYSVIGTSSTANINYKTTFDGDMDNNNTVELLNESIPWEYEFKVFNKGSDNDKYTAEFCATLIQNSTSITLQIYVDGRLKNTDNISNLNEKKCIQQTIELDGMDDY